MNERSIAAGKLTQGVDYADELVGLSLALVLLVAYTKLRATAILSRNLQNGIPDRGDRWHAKREHGKAPRGYLVLTPTRALAFYTADNRKFGTTVDEKAALFDTMGGWSGTYRIEGSKLVFSVDASWTENWNGTNVVRNWQLSGKRLTLASDPQPFARDPSKMVIIQQVWEKIE